MTSVAECCYYKWSGVRHASGSMLYWFFRGIPCCALWYSLQCSCVDLMTHNSKRGLLPDNVSGVAITCVHMLKLTACYWYWLS